MTETNNETSWQELKVDKDYEINIDYPYSIRKNQQKLFRRKIECSEILNTTVLFLKGVKRNKTKNDIYLLCQVSN